MQHYKNFIDGKWIESESKEKIKVDDPSTGKVIGEISCAKKTEVDLAVNAAKKSYNSRILVDMPILARAKLMRKIAEETRKVAKEDWVAYLDCDDYWYPQKLKEQIKFINDDVGLIYSGVDEIDEKGKLIFRGLT